MLGCIGRAKTAAALATCLVLMGGITVNGAPTTLRWKFNAGQKSNYRVVQDMIMEMDVSGQKIKMTTTQTMDMIWLVESVDDNGVADMTQTIDRLQMKMQGAPGADLNYDSNSKEKPQGLGVLLAPMLEAIVKQPIKLKMSPEGKITDVEFPKEMAEKLKTMPGAGPMGNLFSEGNLKQMMGAGTLQFSPKPVEKGDEWQATTEVTNPGMGKQETTTTFTYLGPEEHEGKKCAKIRMKMDVKIAPAKEGQPQVSVEDQESDGTVYFDAKVSLSVDLNLKSKMKMAFDLMGQKLAQTMTNKTTMKPATAAQESEKAKPAVSSDSEIEKQKSNDSDK